MKIDVPIFTVKTKDDVLKGYLIKVRKHLGKGTYSNEETDYMICVNEISDPDGKIRGCFLIDENDIVK